MIKSELAQIRSNLKKYSEFESILPLSLEFKDLSIWTLMTSLSRLSSKYAVGTDSFVKSVNAGL